MTTTSDSLRVLMVSAAYEGAGGVATHLKHLSKALIQHHDISKVSILTTPRNGDKISEGNPEIWRFEFDPFYEINETEESRRFFHSSREMEISVKKKKKLLEPGRRAPYQIVLDQALDRLRRDPHHIIHAHDLDSAFIGILLKVAFKVPLVVTIHRAPKDWKDEKYKESPKDLFVEFMKTYCTCDCIVVPSNTSKDVLVKQGFKGRGKSLEVIPNGIDFDRYVGPHTYDADLIRDLDLKEQTKLILCPVRADENKRPDFFIRAAREIHRRNPSLEIKFLLTAQSRGKYRYLKRMIPKELKEIFVMKEFDYEKMPTLYKHASICVIPSLIESFGQTVLEAFAFKVPVVASYVGALKEIIAHRINGLHFDLSDSENMAKQVTEILQDSKLADDLSKKGYETLRNEYSAELMAKRYCDLYKNLLQKYKVKTIKKAA